MHWPCVGKGMLTQFSTDDHIGDGGLHPPLLQSSLFPLKLKDVTANFYSLSYLTPECQ
jgi:hypothetical protein